MIYDPNNDVLLISNPTGKLPVRTVECKNTVTIDFDVNGKAIGMEIQDASIVLNIPKNIILNLSEVR